MKQLPNPEFDEYYIYTMKPNYPTGMIAQAGKGSTKIAKDSITYCTSGLVDEIRIVFFHIFIKQSKL